MARSFAALLIVSILMSCGSEQPLGPPSEGIGPGLVELEGAVAVVDIPAIVSKGETFTAIIETFGGPGLATSSAYVDVTRDGTTVTLRPYDDYTQRLVPSARLVFQHEVELSFDDRGTFEIIVVGRTDRGFEELTRVYPVSVR